MGQRKGLEMGRARRKKGKTNENSERESESKGRSTKEHRIMKRRRGISARRNSDPVLLGLDGGKRGHALHGAAYVDILQFRVANQHSCEIFAAFTLFRGWEERVRTNCWQ